VNKTLVIIGIIAFAIAGAVGAAFVHTANPDAPATFTLFIGLTFTTLISSIITIAAVGNVNDKVKAVHKQVNGNLDRKEVEIVRLREILAAAGINSDTPTGSINTQSE